MTTIDDLRKMRRETALRDVQQGMFRRGITGRWNDNGSLTASDEPGTIFVRIGATKADDKRPATKCTNTEVDTRSNLHVILWMVDGEWDVFSIDPRERHRLGAAVGNAATVRRAGDLIEETVTGRRLKEGRVRVWSQGTLIVNADPFNYVDNAGAQQRWIPAITNSQDISTHVPAAVDDISQGRWVRLALNPDAGSPELVATAGTAMNTLLYNANGWLDVALDNDYIPLDSVWLQTGDTTIDDEQRYAFSRLILSPFASGAGGDGGGIDLLSASSSMAGKRAPDGELMVAPVDIVRPPGAVMLPSGSGTITVGLVPWRTPNVFGETKQITRVVMSIDTVPEGQDAIADVLKNGTSIFSDPSHRPRILDGEHSGETTTIDDANWEADDYLQVEIIQRGSTVFGANLTISVVFI